VFSSWFSPESFITGLAPECLAQSAHLGPSSPPSRSAAPPRPAPRRPLSGPARGVYASSVSSIANCFCMARSCERAGCLKVKNGVFFPGRGQLLQRGAVLAWRGVSDARPAPARASPLSPRTGAPRGARLPWPLPFHDLWHRWTKYPRECGMKWMSGGAIQAVCRSAAYSEEGLGPEVEP
jgi:hypothetical protein